MRPAPRVWRAAKAQVPVRRADTSKVDRFRPDLAGLIADRLRAEDGFGIVEVMVSAIIVVIISLSTFAALDAAGRTADRNKSRSVASSLAQDDLERLRSVKITDLAALGASAQVSGPCVAGEGARCREVVVDGEKYYVRSKGEYLAGTAGSDNCASDDEAPKYLKITSTVSWDSMGTTRPVTANSLRATPSGTIGDFGSLAVDINGRTGAGQAGIPVTITPDATAAANGGVTTTAATNDKGCVLFGYIATGRYTVTFSKAGYVLAQNPNAPSVTETAVVAADSIASKSYQYDQAGGAAVNYRTNNAFGGTTWTTPANGTEFMIRNAQLGTPSFKTFSNAPAATTASSVWSTSPSPARTRPGPVSASPTSRRLRGSGFAHCSDGGHEQPRRRPPVPPTGAGPAPHQHVDLVDLELRHDSERRQDCGPLHPDDAGLHTTGGRHPLQQQHHQHRGWYGDQPVLDLGCHRALGQLHRLCAVRQRHEHPGQDQRERRGYQHGQRDPVRQQDRHPLPVLSLRMLTRARNQDGFTLIELMVTITLSMLVLFALMTLIDTGGKARARIGDKTESVQRLRNGMDRITRILRTQVCADTGTPPLISGTASSVTFYSDMTTTVSNSAFRPRKVELSYSSDDNGSIVQKVWEPTNTASPWTYPNAASPTRVNTLIDNATAADGGDEVFSYYAFDAINTPLGSR